MEGLILKEEQLLRLERGRREALRDSGRVEFGPGILPCIVERFDELLGPDTAEEEQMTLLEVFYRLKNEAGDLTPDRVVLDVMRRVYEKRSAAEYLAGFSWKELKEDG